MVFQLFDGYSKKRDKLDILAGILHICSKETNKTEIMYQAGISFSQLKEHIALGIERNLLIETEDSGIVKYSTTERGIGLLQRYREIMDILNGNQP